MWSKGDRCIFVSNASGWTFNEDDENVDMVLIRAGTTAKIEWTDKVFPFCERPFVVVDLDDHKFSGYLIKVAERHIYPY